VFGPADAGREAVEQDLGLFAGPDGAELREADGLDGEVADEFSGKAIGGTPRGEDERDGGMAAIGGRWTQRDLITRIRGRDGRCQMWVMS
jgi:hypothetical protein